MSLSGSIRFSAILASVALTAGIASAQKGGHAGGAHAGGAHMSGGHVGGVHVGGARVGGTHYAAPHYAAPHYSSGYRGGYYGGGVGIGVGLYGLGYSPLTSPGYYGGGYGGGLSYGSLGYGYSYPSGSSYYSTPAIPGAYYPQYQYIPPMPPAIDPNAEPTPLPLPGPGGTTPGASTTTLVGSGDTATAKITVISNAGAKVSFDGIASEQTGTRHSFTTKPLSKNGESRIKVVVDGSSISIGVRGGETATVDMRK